MWASQVTDGGGWIGLDWTTWYKSWLGLLKRYVDTLTRHSSSIMSEDSFNFAMAERALGGLQLLLDMDMGKGKLQI
jgi:hypothetical protein